MSVETTMTALQTLHATISGVKTATVAMPSNLSTADLPRVLVWPGEAEWQLAAMGLKRQERVYIVRCFVQPVAQDKPGLDPGYQACVTLLEAFGQAYQDDLTLSDAVDQIRTVSDSGISGGGFELQWGQMPYWGFVYRVTVVEKTT